MKAGQVLIEPDQEACQIFGKFMIALITQATLERGASTAKRTATFVYIDEAQDYFDEGLELLLNQARSAKSIMASTSQRLFLDVELTRGTTGNISQTGQPEGLQLLHSRPPVISSIRFGWISETRGGLLKALRAGVEQKEIQYVL